MGGSYLHEMPQKEKIMNKPDKVIDLTNQIFGRLLVIGFSIVNAQPESR